MPRKRKFLEAATRYHQLSQLTTRTFGSMTISEVGRGDLKRSMLASEDVYVVDVESQLLVWVGSKASEKERAAAFNTASAYLKQSGKPITTPVAVLKEANALRNATFKKIFD